MIIQKVRIITYDRKRNHKKIVKIVRAENFDRLAVGREAYAYDSSPTEISMPLAVISPGNTVEISAIMKNCNENKIPVVTRGEETNLSAGTQPNNDSLVMTVRNMDKVFELDEENLTITVQPGVVTANPRCLLQMQVGIDRIDRKDDLKVVHIVDLLFEAAEIKYDF